MSGGDGLVVFPGHTQDSPFNGASPGNMLDDTPDLAALLAGRHP